MNKMLLKEVERIYANNGQHAEYVVRYTLTGKKVHADNKKATTCADVLDIQVKSFHATVCKGTDIEAHIKADKAKRYGYVTKDFKTMYGMTPAEWLDMVKTFGTVDHDSNTARGRISTYSKGGNGGSNGGGEKIRLMRCEPKIVRWLEGRL